MRLSLFGVLEIAIEYCGGVSSDGREDRGVDFESCSLSSLVRRKVKSWGFLQHSGNIIYVVIQQ